MNYVVTIFAIERYPKLDIDLDTFKQIKAAKSRLDEILALEEKYQILFKNYLDLEKENLSLTAEYMIENPANYSTFFDIRLALNRRIVNLLTATKLYIDQAPQHLKKIFPEKSNVLEDTREIFSKEYDTHFEYRFMDALRNYVQHKGLAVHSSSHGGKWRTLEGMKGFEHSAAYFSHKEICENDKAFKKNVLDEMPDKLELIKTIRVYIESINKIHCTFRKKTQSKIDQSRIIIEEQLNNYQAIYKEPFAGLYAISVKNKKLISKDDERIPIFLELDNLRIELQKKYGEFVNLSKSYVSGNSYSN